MSVSMLSSRERVARALEGRDHDRIPRFDTYWEDTVARWEQDGLVGGCEAALKHLGRDMTYLCPNCDPAPFPGRYEVLEQDEHTRVMLDPWGAVQRSWKDRNGVPEHIRFECSDRNAWETSFKPALIAADVQMDRAAARQAEQSARDPRLWCCLRGHEPFHMIRMMVGDEAELMAMADQPEWVRDMSRTFTDALLRNFQAVLASGIRPDGIWVYGDMAFNHGTLCSPTTYRELIWPDHRRLADWAHENGMKMIYHSDGDVRAVIDLYGEAGFDCLHPLEAKAGLDIRNLADRRGSELSWFGNIDAVVLSSNDPARIEEEVVTKLEAGKRSRRYLYHSDHSVPPGVSWQSYQLIVELLDRHGAY